MTGCNAAFIVDNETKEALIAENPKSAQILRPVLRGRDIKRYKASWAGSWLITTMPSMGINIECYPAVKRHLLKFGREKLEQAGRTLSNGGKSRKKTPHQWFELQDTCAYHEVFKKEKLVWMTMSRVGRFAYSDEEIYCNNAAFIMSGKYLRYICAVLNSRLIAFFVSNTAPTTGLGLTQWVKFVVESIPVPKICNTQQKVFINLINEILEAKILNQKISTMRQEAAIDRLVFALYEINDKEISTVENWWKR